MDAALAVEAEVARQRRLCFPAVAVILQVHFFVLHASPQPLDEHVVQRPAAAIHADHHAGRFQSAPERQGCELGSLVAVEDLRLAHRERSSNASRQKAPVKVFDNRQANT